jgi:probable rRNA maturation factor
MEEVIYKVGKEISRRFALDERTEVSVTFADDLLIQDLNKTYRGIDRATDVLSFAFDEGEDGAPEVPLQDPEIHLLGDIVISLEKTIAQAEEYGHSEERELAFLFVHGMLHLLGYDHQEEKDTNEMRKMEEEILAAVHYKRE